MRVGGRTGAAAVSIVTVLSLSAAGYAWADAADLAPGPLTTRPPASPPPPPPPEPSVSAPAELADPAAEAVPVPEPAPPDADALAAALAPLLADPALGPAPTVSVRDLLTGDELVRLGSTAAVEPASTAKLFTAAAALHVLGAGTTLTTEVAWVPADERPGGRPAVVLVGGGDLLLAAGEGDPGATDGRLGLLDLARAAVLAATEGPPGERLLTAGPDAVVDVVVDDSLLGAPQELGRGPVDSFYASPPSSLAVASGRRGGGLGNDGQPALGAGRAFAAALDQALGEVLGDQAPATGEPQVVSTPVPAGPVLAAGRSAPVADVAALSLVTSDNTVADGLAGLVAAARDRPTDLGSAGRTVVEVVSEDLGVDVGPTTLVDGAGLSDGSVSSAAALSGLLATAAAAPDGDDLALLPGLMPVAGLEGTLSQRFEADGAGAAGRGVVRAKTGTLTGTVALAGVTTTRDGRGASVALLSDGVPAGGTLPARVAADRVVAAVAACC